MIFMPWIRNLYSPISRSMKDVSDTVEIWRIEWLECLERHGRPFDRYEMDKGALNKVRVGCMRTFGSLEDILTMIEDGKQGMPLRTRVHAIRQDANLMQTLRSLWEDEGLTAFMDSYIRDYKDRHGPLID
jgi:hypothetical protein